MWYFCNSGVLLERQGGVLLVGKGMRCVNSVCVSSDSHRGRSVACVMFKSPGASCLIKQHVDVSVCLTRITHRCREICHTGKKIVCGKCVSCRTGKPRGC